MIYPRPNLGPAWKVLEAGKRSELVDVRRLLIVGVVGCKPQDSIADNCGYNRTEQNTDFGFFNQKCLSLERKPADEQGHRKADPTQD